MNRITTRRRRRTAKEDGPDPVDVGVGRRLRLAREDAHMTQVDVASRIGISFQLVQKYEQGEIRVSASRLYNFARLLRKPIDFFFAESDLEVTGSGAPDRWAPKELELVLAYRNITNQDVRNRLCDLVKGMTGMPQADTAKVPTRAPRRPK
jgi:transcriptional regulator with XRE-family HTH domain